MFGGGCILNGLFWFMSWLLEFNNGVWFGIILIDLDYDMDEDFFLGC
jgi:hypothetical protein